jgi:hypothetical protein
MVIIEAEIFEGGQAALNYHSEGSAEFGRDDLLIWRPGMKMRSVR